MKYMLFFFIFTLHLSLLFGKNIDYTSNILQNHLNHIYQNFNPDNLAQQEDLLHLYNYHFDFKQLETLLSQETNIKLRALRVKHYLNTGKVEELLKLKKQYPKYLYLKYSKNCHKQKGKYIAFPYHKTPQFDIQTQNIFPNKTKGCVYLKHKQKALISKPIHFGHTTLSPFFQSSLKQTTFPFFVLKNKYQKINTNKEKLSFIQNIKSPILKDYFELTYYTEIDNLVAYYNKLQSIQHFDLFLTLPHLLKHLRSTNQQAFLKLIKQLHQKHSQNLAVLFFYEDYFKEQQFDLQAINSFFLKNHYHLYEQVEASKKQPYSKGIKRLTQLIKLSPYNLSLYERILPWNHFYRNHPDYQSVLSLYPDKKKPILLLYNVFLNTIGEYILKNTLKTKLESFQRITQAKTLYHSLFDIKEASKDISFFKKEYLALTNQEKQNNHILKRSKHVTLDQQANYKVHTQEAIYFGNTDMKNLYYELSYIDQEEQLTVHHIFLYRDDTLVTIDHHDLLIPYEYEGLYSDMRILRYNLFNYLKPGDLFYIDYTIKSTEKRDYFNHKISILERIKPKSEITHYNYSITHPKTMKLQISYNKDYLQKKEKHLKHKKIIQFTGKNLKAFIPEPYYHFFYKEEPYISASNFQSWKEVKNWFKAIIFDKTYALTPKNKAHFQDLAKKHQLKTKEEITRFFYHYILDHIHYVGIELGIHSYKPYSPNIVFENKYGDCKDRALLYYEIMKLFDIDVQFVLLSTTDSGEHDFKVPSYSYFNHAIVYLPEFKKYLDLTEDDIPYDYLPAHDINSSILIIQDKENVKKLRLQEKDIIKKEFIYSPNKNNVQVLHKEFYYGNTVNHHLKNPFDTLKPYTYERYLNLYYNDIIKNIQFTPKSNHRISPKQFSFQYHLPFSQKHIITLFQDQDLLETKFIQHAIRVNSFMFTYNILYEYSYDFSKFKRLHGFTEEEMDNHFFHAKLFMKDKKVLFSFQLKTNYIPANDQHAFKKKLRELDGILSKKYYLEF